MRSRSAHNGRVQWSVGVSGLRPRAFIRLSLPRGRWEWEDNGESRSPFRPLMSFAPEREPPKSRLLNDAGRWSPCSTTTATTTTTVEGGQPAEAGPGRAHCAANGQNSVSPGAGAKAGVGREDSGAGLCMGGEGHCGEEMVNGFPEPSSPSFVAELGGGQEGGRLSPAPAGNMDGMAPPEQDLGTSKVGDGAKVMETRREIDPQLHHEQLPPALACSCKHHKDSPMTCLEMPKKVPNGDVCTDTLQVVPKRSPAENARSSPGSYDSPDQESGHASLEASDSTQPRQAASCEPDPGLDTLSELSGKLSISPSAENASDCTEDFRDAGFTARPQTLRTNPGYTVSLSCDATPLSPEDDVGFFGDEGGMDGCLSSVNAARRQSAPDKLPEGMCVDPEPSADQKKSVFLEDQRAQGCSCSERTRLAIVWESPSEGKPLALTVGQALRTDDTAGSNRKDSTHSSQNPLKDTRTIQQLLEEVWVRIRRANTTSEVVPQMLNWDQLPAVLLEDPIRPREDNQHVWMYVICTDGFIPRWVECAFHMDECVQRMPQNLPPFSPKEYEAGAGPGPGTGPHPRQPMRRKNLEFEPLSTTALILEDRPANLPAKSEEEAQRHRQEYNEMVAGAKRREMKEAQRKKKQMKERYRQEENIAHAMVIWNTEILPNWESLKNTRRVRELWWQGLPPSVRGKVWSLAIGNELNITPELYEIFLSRAKEKWRSFNETSSVSENEDCGASLADRESSLDLIKLDIFRTFPSLYIFQKGGPYHDLLHSVLGAYTCYRPDVGYVQGMSFIAAVLILNLEEADAFIAFANLLNKPCQLAFFRVDHDLMLKYFAAFEVFFEENLPKLFQHFQNNSLTPDFYLIDWIFTLYSKSLPLDVACRVWDLFCRDGEEALFRTGLGILRLYQDVLLQMDFIHTAQFLSRLPENTPAHTLFNCIANTHMLSNNRRWNQLEALLSKKRIFFENQVDSSGIRSRSVVVVPGEWISLLDRTVPYGQPGTCLHLEQEKVPSADPR
ncbi:hypothetical protein NFI96_031941 [Prochilodus magdalenae]|nr:hypothetical protein NFI96_031941 [Prochilodus magdalenae]